MNLQTLASHILPCFFSSKTNCKEQVLCAFAACQADSPHVGNAHQGGERCFTGLVLPVLGALPDSLIIVVSGIGVSREVAQEQVRHPHCCTLGRA